MLNSNIDTEHREERRGEQSRALSIILEPKEEGDSLASICQMQTRNCDKEEGRRQLARDRVQSLGI